MPGCHSSLPLGAVHKLDMTRDDIPLNIMKVQNKYFSCSGILDVKQNGGVGLDEDNIRWA
jgi:hypothetical protein